jgi:hypothetical protein
MPERQPKDLFGVAGAERGGADVGLVVHVTSDFDEGGEVGVYGRVGFWTEGLRLRDGVGRSLNRVRCTARWQVRLRARLSEAVAEQAERREPHLQREGRSTAGAEEALTGEMSRGTGSVAPTAFDLGEIAPAWSGSGGHAAIQGGRRTA